MKFDAAYKALQKGETIKRTALTHSEIKIIKGNMIRMKAGGVQTACRLSGKDLMANDWVKVRNSGK